jgi:hypothetical protein
MGLPAGTTTTPNYRIVTTKANPIEEILAVICVLLRSGGIKNYDDWVQVMEATVGPEVVPYLESVWKRITGVEAVQTKPSGKTQFPGPHPNPIIDALLGAASPQLPLFPSEPFDEILQLIMLFQLKTHKQPSGWEFLNVVEDRLGWKARWYIRPALQKLAENPSLTRAARDYLDCLLNSGELTQALRGADAPKMEVRTGIDTLLHQSKAYQSSAAFQEMVNFMANFRDYAPYNNMLVRT